MVAASALIERSPDVTAGPAGEALITWDGYSPVDQNFRAYGRLFTEPAFDAGANEPDAGSNELDAGANEPDAGANEPDAGANELDAGANEPDGGTTNEPDAGVGDDGGLVEFEQRDGGDLAPTTRYLAVGCSVAPVPWLLFAALLLLSASRSRRRPSSG